MLPAEAMKKLSGLDSGNGGNTVAGMEDTAIEAYYRPW